MFADLFGIPPQALLGQLLLGLINGAFYALLSLGLALIFGLLHLINFAHGAIYMLGALGAWVAVSGLGLSFWAALIIVPLAVGLIGIVLERVLISRLAGLDPLYGLLLTFGLALLIEGLTRVQFGASGLPFNSPIKGGINLGFMYLPWYRGFVVLASVVVCLATWFAIERTKLGALLRAATENPDLLRTFGVRVPVLVTLTFGAGVALAALAGVLAAPIYLINPYMGTQLIIVVFAVVVIGGMGSIGGAILTGFGLGVLEGLTKAFWPPASSTVIFFVMAVVLMVKPAGLFGTTK
ncbi:MULTISPECIES: branched-chain amino acid ABC transporter permease [Salipiger]|uniref:Amino acid/amide ABC transporter membrane protein 1, HAAT family n=1 Tax=Salipiger profundus TaxID=1229727 RepID=A0A1U7DDD8_9RHOB|nr:MULTISPECIES: branched-chain amino acid ABC transporter permease [Salipiger]APX26171.1 amino acid/amide ABC transporter membrane protein 1, HAAT family [Salipiger profundus]GGA23581.1 branched-chain amino acid ABC transporter permease [Salipiger profundus]